MQGSYIFLLIFVAAIWVVFMFNSLTRSKNRVDEAASDIDVQLKRRHDLIPNLVEAVKGYMNHERDTLTKLTEARAAAVSVGDNKQASLADREKVENNLAGALRTVFAVAENYPDLKASQNFLQLQSDLTDTEDKIQAARRFFNSMVRDFNTKLQVFPTNMFANMMHFTKYDFFQATDEERQNVQVKF